jgi:hypothetical protein
MATPKGGQKYLCSVPLVDPKWEKDSWDVIKGACQKCVDANYNFEMEKDARLEVITTESAYIKALLWEWMIAEKADFIKLKKELAKRKLPIVIGVVKSPLVISPIQAVFGVNPFDKSKLMGYIAMIGVAEGGNALGAATDDKLLLAGMSVYKTLVGG